MEILETFLQPSAWIALVALTFLQIVLGIDNIVFLSIISSKLPHNKQSLAREIGLFIAMFFRILLLFCISWIMQLTKPLFSFDTTWIDGAISARSIIIFVAGIFLLYKSVTEIHHKLEEQDDTEKAKYSGKKGFWGVVIQIIALDIVFSFDSIFTAIGMVSFDEYGYAGALTIMVTAVVISVIIMMVFINVVSDFINNHPTIQILGLSFLILIGVMLLAEAAHLSNLVVFGSSVGEIPKGYIYFAIAFSLLVEYFNSKLRKNKEPIQFIRTIDTSKKKKM